MRIRGYAEVPGPDLSFLADIDQSIPVRMLTVLRIEALHPESEPSFVQGGFAKSPVSDAASKNKVDGDVILTCFFKLTGTMREHTGLRGKSINRLALPGQYGITVSSGIPIVTGRLWFTKLPNGINIGLLSLLKEQGWIDEDGYGWGRTKVSYLIAGESYNTCSDWKNPYLIDRKITDREPGALIDRHLIKLALHRPGLSLHSVSLPPGLTRQIGEVADSGLEVGSVRSVLVGEIRDRERSHANEERKPLIDGDAARKATGIALALLATVLGAAGYALFIRAVSGRDFGLTDAKRRLYAAGSMLLFGVAFFVLSQWASPLLRGPERESFGMTNLYARVLP